MVIDHIPLLEQRDLMEMTWILLSMVSFQIGAEENRYWLQNEPNQASMIFHL